MTHGLVCYAFALRNLRVSKRDEISPTDFANTSLTIVEAHPPFRVELLGCTTHLDLDRNQDESRRAQGGHDSVC